MKRIIIHFEDHGQDFLTWEVDVATGWVMDCQPFQFGIWSRALVIDPELLEVGGLVNYIMYDEHYDIKYPIEKIEIL